jgi:hypothetical protein
MSGLRSQACPNEHPLSHWTCITGDPSPTWLSVFKEPLTGSGQGLEAVWRPSTRNSFEALQSVRKR